MAAPHRGQRTAAMIFCSRCRLAIVEVRGDGGHRALAVEAEHDIPWSLPVTAVASFVAVRAALRGQQGLLPFQPDEQEGLGERIGGE
jgi:hypothetical protein